MSLAAPLGLLGLLAVPVVLALHLLRRRLVERRVAGLFLFAADPMAEAAGPVRSSLLRTPSLWLELAAAALLGTALALPQCSGPARAVHLVAVLDDTASLGATVDGAPAAARARAALEARLAALPADAVVTLLRTGAPPSALAGPRTDRASARAALDGWRPTAPAHDAAPALDLAAELAGPDAPVLFLTDAPDPEVGERVEVVATGRAAGNAAVVHGARVPSGDLETVLLDVAAWAPGPFPTEVVVAAGRDGAWQELARRPVVVTPGRVARLTLDVPASDLDLRATLGPDPLALDGELVLLPVPRRAVPFAVVAGEPTRSRLRLDRLARALPGVVEAPEADAALVIADAEGPVPVGGTRVVVAPTGGPERDDWLGPFLVDRADDLTEGLALEGLVWSSGRGALQGHGLVFAGDHPLLAVEETAAGIVVRLDLDPARCTLGDAPDGPVLWSNVVERTRRRLPGPVSTSAAVGAEVAYRLGAGDGDAAAWRLVAPSGRAERPSAAGATLVFAVAEPGVHRLVAPRGDVARFAVGFVDPRESDLTGRGAATRPPRRAPAGPATAAAGAGAGPAVRGLGLAALLVGLADALVLGRGRRRAPA